MNLSKQKEHKDRLTESAPNKVKPTSTPLLVSDVVTYDSKDHFYKKNSNVASEMLSRLTDFFPKK